MIKQILNRSAVIIVLAIVAIFVFCGALFAFVDFFYDGGIICFASPKSCNTTIEASVLPVEFPTITPRPDSTLAPTPTQFITPTLFLTFTPSAPKIAIVGRIDDDNVTCGRNTYKYNDIAIQWERRFSSFCFQFIHDPFESIFWGLDYGQVAVVLQTMRIDNLSQGEQIARLIGVGMWDVTCNCVPENAPGLGSEDIIPATATPEPLNKDN